MIVVVLLVRRSPSVFLSSFPSSQFCFVVWETKRGYGNTHLRQLRAKGGYSQELHKMERQTCCDPRDTTNMWGKVYS